MCSSQKKLEIVGRKVANTLTIDVCCIGGNPDTDACVNFVIDVNNDNVAIGTGTEPPKELTLSLRDLRCILDILQPAEPLFVYRTKS